jgi:four helix bundle protein
MSIERFEDIKAWQEARILVKMIFDAIRDSRDLTGDYRLRGQMQGAAISVMSNIAEGFSRRSAREFAQFLFVSKASLAEVQSQLYVALDQSYISKEDFYELYAKCEEVARLISGFIHYLLNKDKKPPTRQTQ